MDLIDVGYVVDYVDFVMNGLIKVCEDYFDLILFDFGLFDFDGGDVV